VLYAHQRYGKLDFAEVVTPAIHEAREGVRLTEFSARTFQLLDAILRSTASARDTFMKRVGDEYHSLEEGDLFRNERFACFLEDLVANPDAGLLRAEYEAAGIIYEPSPIEELEPLTTTIGIHRVYTVPPPFPGGLLMQHSLLQVGCGYAWIVCVGTALWAYFVGMSGCARYTRVGVFFCLCHCARVRAHVRVCLSVWLTVWWWCFRVVCLCACDSLALSLCAFSCM
jgi:Gamma-glutamyltranspeptidase